MGESETVPLLRQAEEVEYGPTEVEGLRKGTLVGEADGAPNFAMRRFELDPHTSVPRHTNEVEHVQYVLEGEYVVGLGDRERTVRPGDALLIPAGEVHWYRNERDQQGAFICAVPHGDDAITIVD